MLFANVFSIVELNVRRKIGNDTRCFAERNEEFRFQFWMNDSLLVEGLASLIDDGQERTLFESVQGGYGLL